MSIGPPAASPISRRSSASTPVIWTTRTRGPKRLARSSSARPLRPTATTLPAPIASATATPAPPKPPVAPFTTIVSPAFRSPAISPPKGTSSRPRAVQRPAWAGSMSPIRVAFSVGTSICSAKEP
jgi:hypothetical protein